MRIIRLFLVLLAIGAVVGTACTPPPDPEPPAEPYTYLVDPEVPVAQQDRLDENGEPVTYAAVDTPTGEPSTFIANQVVVNPADQAALEEFLQRTGGTVIADDGVPLPPADSEIEVDPAAAAPTSYTVRFDPATIDLEDLAEDATTLGFTGGVRFSSPEGAAATALVAAERRDGLEVGLDFVGEGDYMPSTGEAPVSGSYDNALGYAEVQSTGGRSNVAAAWQYLDSRSITRTTRVAILDGGFRVDANGFAEVTSLGTDFPAKPLQWDFVNDDPVVGDTNPTNCSSGNPCPWHGNKSASAATADLDDGEGAAGSGGQVAEPVMFHIDMSMSQTNAAVRTAALWGVDVISMSYSQTCNQACLDSAADFVFAPAVEAGIALVASAGNAGRDVRDGTDEIQPCVLDEVICVGALHPGTTNRANFAGGWSSNWGDEVDIYAPTNLTVQPTPGGEKIAAACLPGAVDDLDCLHSYGGTSASAPFVAGVLAMMASVATDWSTTIASDALLGAAWTDSTDPLVTRHLNASQAVRVVGGDWLDPDANEPDNTALQATPVTIPPGFGEVVEPDLTMHNGADIDHVSFSVPGTNNISITHRFPEPLGGVRGEITRTDGSACGNIREGTSTSGPDQHRIEYRLSAGSYTVRSRSVTSTAVPYEMRIGHQSTFSPIDDFEGPSGNNNLGNAAPVTSGRGEQEASLSPGSGQDWYRLQSTGSRSHVLVGGTKYRFAIAWSDVALIVTSYADSGAELETQVSDAGCAALPNLDLPAGTVFVQVRPVNPAAVGEYAFIAGERTVSGRLFDQGALWADVVRPGDPVSLGIRSEIEKFGLVASTPAANADHLKVNVAPNVRTRLLDGEGQVVAVGQRDQGSPQVADLVGDLRSGEPYVLEVTKDPGTHVGGVTVPAVVTSEDAPPPPDRLSLAAAHSHTCAARPDGTAACWGDNDYGQLGNGTIAASNTPVQTVVTGEVESMTTGTYHSCAVRRDSTMACWGYNAYGQLGDGTTGSSVEPVEVSGLSGVTTAAAGFNHTCALRTDGSLACWGYNGYGQLGNGTTGSTSEPTEVDLPEPVVAVTAAGNTTCARSATGNAWCWGYNGSGNLGDGTLSHRSTPVLAIGDGTVTSLDAAGEHTCATLSDGSVACWGFNGYGQLGDDSTTNRPTPGAVSSPEGVSFTSVSVGVNHSCAVSEEGAVHCWGQGLFGQLGLDSQANQSSPVEIPGFNATAVVAGGWHTCAVDPFEAVWCWGQGGLGQLGSGGWNDELEPVQVPL